MPHTVPVAFSSYAGMDIGRDNGLVVDRAYEDKAPNALAGTVKKVVFDLKPASRHDEQACTNTRKSRPSATEPKGEGHRAGPGRRRPGKTGRCKGLLLRFRSSAGTKKTLVRGVPAALVYRETSRAELGRGSGG
jgi:hypothetical protein